MRVKPFRCDSEWYVVASLRGGRFLIANVTQMSLCKDVILPGVSDECFDVSADGRFLAVADWDSPGVRLWDLATDRLLSRYGPSQVSGILLDNSSRYVAVRSQKGGRVYDLQTGEAKPLTHCGNIWEGASLNRQDNWMLVPSRRRGQVLLVKCDPFVVESLRLPLDKVVWTLRCSPDSSEFVALDTGRHVVCIAGGADQLKWTATLHDCFSTASYSGDATLISISGNDPPRTIVLDACSGSVIGKVDGHFGGTYPWQGTVVMTSDGQIIDLGSGHVDKRISSVSWWRTLGVGDDTGKRVSEA